METIQAFYKEKHRVTSYVKDAYLLILTGIFFNSPMKEFKWDPDDDISKLTISDRLHKPDVKQNNKPSIYIARQSMVYAKTNINQETTRNSMKSSITYGDLIRGTMLVNCVSSEGLEAEELGSAVFTLLQAYKDEFLKLGFHKFEVLELSPERLIKTQYDTELIEVAVITSYAFLHNVCVKEMNLKALKDICLTRAMKSDTENPCAVLPDGTYKCQEFGPDPSIIQEVPNDIPECS